MNLQMRIVSNKVPENPMRHTQENTSHHTQNMQHLKHHKTTLGTPRGTP